jgi:hypothetical protein
VLRLQVCVSDDDRTEKESSEEADDDAHAPEGDEEGDADDEDGAPEEAEESADDAADAGEAGADDEAGAPEEAEESADGEDESAGEEQPAEQQADQQAEQQADQQAELKLALTKLEVAQQEVAKYAKMLKKVEAELEEKNRILDVIKAQVRCPPAGGPRADTAGRAASR